MPLDETLTLTDTGHLEAHQTVHIAVNALVALADLFDLTEYTPRYVLADPATIGELRDVVATFINGVKALSS